jgi:hypothetical protein
MAIERLSSRPGVSGTAVDTKSASTSSAPKAAMPAHASGMLDAPAATSHVSPNSVILALMQTFETLHPEQAKALLLSIAERLHADASTGGAFASAFAAWGDKFQLAADSGELSHLLPSISPSPHFGVRAYQAAQQQAPDDASVFLSSAPSSTGDVEAATARVLETVNDSMRALGAPTELRTSLQAEEYAANYLVQPEHRRRHRRQSRRRLRQRLRKYAQRKRPGA